MKRLKDILVFVFVIVYVSDAFATGDIYTHNSVLSSGNWVEIGVTETGINTITPALIQKAGFSDMSRIKVYGYGGALQPDTLKPYYLKTHDDLSEIPTYTYGGNKYFYGQGPVSWARKDCYYRTRNPYASYGGYFITEGDSPLICTQDSLLQIANSNYAAYHSIYEVDNYALTESGTNLFDKASVTKGDSVKYTVYVPAGTSSAKITVSVASSTAGTTYTLSTIGTDNKWSGKFSSSGVSIVTHTFDLNATDLAQVTDGQVPVTISNLSGTSSAGTLYLDFISASYDSSNVPSQIDGNTFPEASYIYAIDKQNHHADEACDLIVIIPPYQNNLYQANRLCELHKKKDGITYNIIPADELYSEFSSGTPDITAFRRYLKMLYDRSGQKAKDKTLTSKTPKWVLLFGDTYFDNRVLTGGKDAYDLLPVFETEDLYRNGYSSGYSISETGSFCSDDYITCLQDGKYTNMYGSEDSLSVSYDIAVGRIPASTNAEAKVYVDKIEHYMDSQYNGTWQRDIMFIGGTSRDESDATKHIAQIDENANLVIGRQLGYNVKKVLTPSYTTETSSTGTTHPQATQVIIKQQNAGALIMDYGGHAGSTQLSNDKALMISDFKSFSGNNYSVWITAGCQTMPYDKSSSIIGVEAVRNANGGAIAFVGTSREVYPDPNTALNKTLVYNLLTYTSENSPITLGEAMRRTKCSLVSSNGYKSYYDPYSKYQKQLKDASINKHQYNLVGDPALHINLPIDSVMVNVTDIIGERGDDNRQDGDTVVFQGLEKVTVKGLLCGVNGTERHYSSSAKIFLKVMDSAVKETGTEYEKSYSFQNRKSVLYEGVSKFTDDTFECTFRVPEEINDNKAPAQLLFFVIDDSLPSRTAKGEFDAIKFSGVMPHEQSATTPDVYCYLNTNTFVNGDVVGPTPFFVAELKDEEGLLVSESVGHNLELVVDGSADMTYDLNDNFTFDYNSYTSGQTYKVLPTLSAGLHTVRFRVWNLLGTMVTKELQFYVKKEQLPNLTEVSTSKAITKTGDNINFYVWSDFTGSSANIEVEIFDTTGRKCFSIPYSGISLGNDLEAKNYEDTRSQRSCTSLSWTVGGLSNGLYVYRVRVSCDGYNYVSKVKKLLVMQ